MHLKSLTLAISSLFVATSAFASDLSKETQTYKNLWLDKSISWFQILKNLSVI